MAYSARYPRPLNAKLLCPLGKLLHPSCKVWWSCSVHTSIVTSLCSGVLLAGLQRAIRSGRGRPTAFFMTSVMNDVRIKLIRKPRMVTWVLWIPGWMTAAQRISIRNGRRPEYAIFHAGRRYQLKDTTTRFLHRRKGRYSYLLGPARCQHEEIV